MSELLTPELTDASRGFSFTLSHAHAHARAHIAHLTEGQRLILILLRILPSQFTRMLRKRRRKKETKYPVQSTFCVYSLYTYFVAARILLFEPPTCCQLAPFVATTVIRSLKTELEPRTLRWSKQKFFFSISLSFCFPFSAFCGSL